VIADIGRLELNSDLISNRYSERQVVSDIGSLTKENSLLGDDLKQKP
jgi:hypothetical protein